VKVTQIPLTIKVFYEGTSKEAPYVAFNPELNISSAGKTKKQAKAMLSEAIRIILDGAQADGTIEVLLEDAKLLIKDHTGTHIPDQSSNQSLFPVSIDTTSHKREVYG